MSIDPTISTALLAALEQAVNGALALDPATLQRLQRLEGKVIAVELTAPPMTVFVTPGEQGLRLMGHFGGEPDAMLIGSPFALARAAATPRGVPTTGAFTGDLVIQGDVQVGQQLQRILAGLDLDLEEHLSRVTGDVVAHQVANGLRNFAQWAAHAVDTLGRNTSEYLTEESRTLPTRVEVEGFARAVETLRDDVERLDARLKRLARQIPTP